MIFAMCNASFANATTNDQTIKKCMRFARQHNGGGILVVNAASVISTEPTYLLEVEPICDEANIEVLRTVLSTQQGRCVAAWGSWQRAIRQRLEPGIAAIKRYGMQLQCFGLTKSGEPRHPVRLPYDTPLVPFG